MNFEVKNLSCIRGSQYLFRKINFKLSSGQLLHIHGQNGSGKSTLLKILAGLSLPEKGAIYWDGQNITHASAGYHSNISYLAHKNGLSRGLSPLENMAKTISLAGESCARATMEEQLLNLNLPKHCHEITCEHLSAGQCRKVMLATILLQQKKLWLLDEPLTALDKLSMQQMYTYFEQHLEKGGMIIMSSHHFEGNAYHQIIDLSS